VGDSAESCPPLAVQISSHGGSRLQEAQRLGRILRKKINKGRSADGFDSYFYTLLSLDTMEMFFSEKRRRYLVAQGYEYHVRSCWD
jgi:DNA excision repair protein ERCC-3